MRREQPQVCSPIASLGISGASLGATGDTAFHSASCFFYCLEVFSSIFIVSQVISFQCKAFSLHQSAVR